MLNVVSKHEEGPWGVEKGKLMVGGIKASTKAYINDRLSRSSAESTLTTLSHFQNIRIVSSPSSTAILLMSLPYPTAYQIEEMFANRLDHNTFHSYLADNPNVTVVGKDFPLAGNHKSADTFHTGTNARFVAPLKEDTIRIA